MTIPEQAVQAALDKWRDHEFNGTLDIPRMRASLTAAAPYMQDAARDQALEEVAMLIETHAYTDGPKGKSLEPSVYAKSDQHHATIATAIRTLKSQPAQTGWLPIKEEPDNTKGPFLVTNNSKALNAFDRPSHVWCVSGIYTDDDGSFCAFEGSQKIHGLTMFMPVVSPQTGGGDE